MSRCPTCQKPVQDGLRFCPQCGSRMVQGEKAPEDPMIGRNIANNFRLLEVIGTGAMGTIYRAEQLSLGKTVVIKLLHRHLLGDPTLSKRFHREARAASILNHPNIITITDFGQIPEGPLYIAMEYVAGMDLADLLYREYPLDPRRIIHVTRQICMALDEAHANGVLHRDLKPENIMVSDRRNMKDFVKVLDFGIAKLQDKGQNPNSFQTIAGVVCGTPEYMSPEQARGEELDGRTDLYALGVMLYQMLTNRLPFDGESPLVIVTKHLSEKPAPPSSLAPDVPAGLENLVLSLLAKDRDLRPASALDVVAELDRIDREIEARRLREEGPGDTTLVEMRAVAVEPPPEPPRPTDPSEDRTDRGLQPVDLDLRLDLGPPVAPRRPPLPPSTPPGAQRTARPSPPPRPVPPETPGAADAPLAAFERVAPNGPWQSTRLWLVAVLIGAAVALAGWFIYRALVPTRYERGSSPPAPAESAAPSPGLRELDA